MRLLLDSHTLLWWLLGDTRLSPAQRETLASEDTEVLVSAATGWEIATKYRIGKLPVPERLVRDLPTLVAEQGFEVLDISLLHAVRAGVLPGDHRDPFDRLLAAQSILEGVPIVSGDPALDTLGVTRIPP